MPNITVNIKVNIKNNIKDSIKDHIKDIIKNNIKNNIKKTTMGCDLIVISLVYHFFWLERVNPVFTYLYQICFPQCNFVDAIWI